VFLYFVHIEMPRIAHDMALFPYAHD